MPQLVEGITGEVVSLGTLRNLTHGRRRPSSKTIKTADTTGKQLHHRVHLRNDLRLLRQHNFSVW